MKNLPAIAAIGVLSLGFASAASAAGFSPAATKFTASGEIMVTQNGATTTCAASLKGATNKSGKEGRIYSATFSGANPNCASLAAATLPWKIEPNPAGGGNFRIEQFTLISSVGTCGPDRLPARLSGGVITFNHTLNPGACQVSGSLTTSPTISVTP